MPQTKKLALRPLAARRAHTLLLAFMVNKDRAQACTAHAILFALQHILEANLGFVSLSPYPFLKILWFLGRGSNAAGETANITPKSIRIIDIGGLDLPCMANRIKSRIFFGLTTL